MKEVCSIGDSLDQCREQIKQHKNDGNSPSSYPFLKECDRVLDTVLSTEPPALHSSLVSQASDLLIPKSTLGLEGSQQVPDEADKVTLVLKLVPKEALLPA